MSVTVFNPDNPKDAAKLQAHLAVLGERNRKDLQALHVLETSDGVWHCLDFGVEAAIKDELWVFMRSLYEAPVSPREVLSPAAPDLWSRLVAASLVGYEVLRRLKGFRGCLVVVVCSEVSGV